MKFHLAGIVVIGTLLLSACQRQDSAANSQGDDPPETVLVKVGAHEITLAEFTAELERRAKGNPGAYATVAQRHQLLQEMIAFEVLLTRALEAGYDQEPDIQRRMNEFLVSRFQEAQLAKLNASAASLDEDQQREFYEQHPDQFRTPPTIRVGIIAFHVSSKATPPKRETARQHAEAIRGSAVAADASAFARLAQQHSEDQATRYIGGDAGWWERDAVPHRWPELVSTTAFALSQPGEVAPLIETSGGFYIVRLVEKRAAQTRPFAEVKEAIAYQLAQQQAFATQEKLRQELARGLTIETNVTAWESLAMPAPVAERSPPRLPGG